MGNSYLTINDWNKFKENTIFYNVNSYTNLEDAKSNHLKIYEFEDVIFDGSLKSSDKRHLQKCLNENCNKFYDNTMIQFLRQQDDIILSSLYKTSIKINTEIYVDKEKLKKWLKICMYLDNISFEECKDIALKNKYLKLEQENKRLKDILYNKEE